METSWKVGDRVKGELQNAPKIVAVGGRKVKESANWFEGEVVAVEDAESSEVGEELVEVKYTKPALWSKMHGETKGWYYACELQGL